MFQENADRSWREHEAWLDRQPKVNFSYQAWLDVKARREQEKQEKIARGEFPDTNGSAPLVPQKLTFPPIPEQQQLEQLPPEETNESKELKYERNKLKDQIKRQRRERNIPIVYALYNQLAIEVNKSELNLIAADIRTHLWGNNSTTEIEPVEWGKIDIKDDGAVRNRTQLGYILSCSQEQNLRNEVFMGIGYFDDRANIIPPAQDTVSDEDLKKGVKAYFLKRRFVNKNSKKIETFMEVIPFAYAEAQQTFLEHLYDAAVTLAPRKSKPHARHRRNQPLAAAA